MSCIRSASLESHHGTMAPQEEDGTLAAFYCKGDEVLAVATLGRWATVGVAEGAEVGEQDEVA